MPLEVATSSRWSVCLCVWPLSVRMTTYSTREKSTHISSMYRVVKLSQNKHTRWLCEHKQGWSKPFVSKWIASPLKPYFLKCIFLLKPLWLSWVWDRLPLFLTQKLLMRCHITCCWLELPVTVHTALNDHYCFSTFDWKTLKLRRNCIVVLRQLNNYKPTQKTVCVHNHGNPVS